MGQQPRCYPAKGPETFQNGDLMIDRVIRNRERTHDARFAPIARQRRDRMLAAGQFALQAEPTREDARTSRDHLL